MHLFGADLVQQAIKGVGNQVTGYAGAMVDARYVPPLLISGK
jgi:hypothetical protein